MYPLADVSDTDFLIEYFYQAKSLFEILSVLKTFETNRRNPMSAEERIKATAKNIEGKAQEAYGNVTGDVEHQVAGKAKQVESSVRHAKEDVKDELKGDIDRA